MRRPPTRSCVACRTGRPKRELVRVVRTPTGELRVDPTGRLAGRGAYLCVDPACWRRALERGALTRALGTPLDDGIRSVLEAGPAAVTDPAGNITNTSLTTTTGGDTRGEE